MRETASRGPARTDSTRLGSAGRRRDLVFGWTACGPLLLLAASAWAGLLDQLVLRRLALDWTATLLAFLGGVRRGLVFSEARGGSVPEIASMFALFALALFTLVFSSLLVGAAGLCAAGVLDAAAGARREAPGYFRRFRPVQMGLCAAAMLAIALAPSHPR